jgi:glyoxylase-like metal-dependent hydrolase (beta-lactamase superfamily II)
LENTVAAESIFDGVYQVGPGYVNSFIVDGDEGVTLVDTLLPGKAEAIGEGLRGIGRSFEDVKAILVTHSHADHSGSAAAVKAQTRASLYASEADAPAIQGVVKPPSPPTPLYVKPLAVLMSLMPGPPAAEVDHFVSEASGASLPGDLRAIDTPGHTPGHTSFLLDRGGGVLFVGDAARATKEGKVVRGYFNRSTPLIDSSLSHLAELGFEIAAFGHSDPIRTEASSAFRRFAESLE